MNSPGLSPLTLLQQLENDSLGDQLTGRDIVSGEFWRGFTFKIDELNLVVPFLGGVEIIPCQALSPVPMAKSWVKGMMNIRGEIYTVVDFSEFIGKEPIRTTRGCNLFVLPDTRLKSALLITSRINLQSFNSESPTTRMDSLPNEITPFLSTVLVEGGVHWGVIDIHALANSDHFSHVGR